MTKQEFVARTVAVWLQRWGGAAAQKMARLQGRNDLGNAENYPESLGRVLEVGDLPGWPFGEVAGGHPDGEVAGDVV
ncbi:hypothetical protein ABT072_44415, partial [Streptomyces sp. NPDC002589]|uniref:hypothetical protein n=1 Tax=Streptomyces sp. NPDC002589 TaxID=3154420 RepID=UPI00332D48BA